MKHRKLLAAAPEDMTRRNLHIIYKFTFEHGILYKSSSQDINAPW